MYNVSVFRVLARGGAGGAERAGGEEHDERAAKERRLLLRHPSRHTRVGPSSLKLDDFGWTYILCADRELDGCIVMCR